MHRSWSAVSLVTVRVAAIALIAGSLGPPRASAQIGTSGRPGTGLPGGTSSGPTGGPARTVPDPAQVHHVLDRITYGATNDDLAIVRAIGIEDFIRMQLRPDGIPESPVLEARLAALPPRENPVGDPDWLWGELYSDYLLRARYSNRQLQAVMTEWYSNHFDTGLDQGGSDRAGWFASLKFNPTTNRPAVAYFSSNYQRALFAWHDGSAWLWNVVDDGDWLTGTYVSLAFHPITGEPSVAYYDEGESRVEFKHFDGTDWLPTAEAAQGVDNAGDVGRFTSLGFDPAGVAYIAYYDASNGDLKIASGAPQAWTVLTVDAGGDVGTHASLAMQPSGRPGIAYRDETNRRLKYAWHDGAQWRNEVVDPAAGTGQWASLAFDGLGNPAIAYYDDANADLRYAVRAGTWSIETVASAGRVGTHASLAFAPGGAPSIAYHSQDPTYDLELARWNSTLLRWDLATVESGIQIAGEWASLGFHPITGHPGIAFHNGSGHDLRYDEWIGTAWQRQFVYGTFTDDFFRVRWEGLEADGFRANAFGRFRDLLQISATSTAMMIFLNNDMNSAGSGNENYARELLELHTVGVDGGYSQLDVETLARALTGWTAGYRSPRCDVTIGDFCYNHFAHDGTEKVIMGRTFAADDSPAPSNWMKQGLEILDFLASHPQTARFICHKLIQKFVADDPPQRLATQCQETFLQSDGNMGRVLESLLLSDEFLHEPTLRNNKVRDPFEFVLAAVRHLEADVPRHALWDPISNIGMALFHQAVPTGWPEVGVEWISTNSFLRRWQFADRLTHNDVGTYTVDPFVWLPVTLDPYSLVRPTGLSTAEGVVEFFVQRLLHGTIEDADRAALIDCVSNGSPSTFDIDDPATPGRLRDTVSVMLGSPNYQKN